MSVCRFFWMHVRDYMKVFCGNACLGFKSFDNIDCYLLFYRLGFFSPPPFFIFFFFFVTPS